MAKAEREETDPINFSHRPFSMTVERISDAPLMQQVGDIRLTMYLKLPPDKAREMLKKLADKIVEDREGFVILYLEGLMK